MLSRLLAMLITVRSLFKTQRQLTLENLALRQQLAMLKPSVKRPQVSAIDRFIVLCHDRRHIVHFNVTAHPTAQWTTQQLVEAFPFDTAPRYLLRDRDGIYGEIVQRRIKSLGIEDVVTAPRSPWQNPFVERVIGSIRRDCLNHVIVINEAHLRRILRGYLSYYHTSRTQLSFDKDSPDTRVVEPPESGNIVAFPCVGGLHRRYARVAA